jgi:hypothetical protein
MKKFNTSTFIPGKKYQSYHTWPALAAALDVPHGWLSGHCNKRLKQAMANNGGYSVDVQHEPLRM